MRRFWHFLGHPVGYVFLLGFVIRLIACWHTQIINPDGALYIDQAKAIFYGKWDDLFCSFPYLSNYPILIAALFSLCRDWVVSARVVSLIMGWAMLIPLYCLTKRFYSNRVSMSTLLIFTLLPVMVGASADILRDPISWFFLALGLYFFTDLFSGRIEDKNPFYLFIAMGCFLVSAWARAECVIFIVASISYLLLTKSNKKIEKLAFFLLPVLILFVISFWIFNKDGILPGDLFAEKQLSTLLPSSSKAYNELREKLKLLSEIHRYEPIGEFIMEARKNIWIVAAGSLFNRTLEAFLYVFLVVLGMGIFKMVRPGRRTPQAHYFFLLLIVVGFLLYIRILLVWMIDYRHVVLILIPGAFFLGAGLDSIFQLLEEKFNDRKLAITFLTVLLITGILLPKSVMKREEDKLVFKRIGEFIAAREGNDAPIRLSASFHTFRWVSFYANLNYRGPTCAEASKSNCWEFFPSDFDQFVHHFKSERLTYFLWAEKQWPTDRKDWIEDKMNKHFKYIKEWRHADTGKLILFELQSD